MLEPAPAIFGRIRSARFQWGVKEGEGERTNEQSRGTRGIHVVEYQEKKGRMVIV